MPFRFLLLPVCLLLLAPTAAAQSAADVLDRSLAAYEAMMRDVADYTLTQEVMGIETTMYFERRGDGGPFDFATFMMTPEGWQEVGDEDAAMPMQNPAMLARMKAQARLVGTESVDGKAAHVVAVDDFGAIAREFNTMPDVGEGEFDIETATFYFGTDDGLLYQLTMAGTMAQEGNSSPVEVDIAYADYRTVSGLRYPFQTTMTMRGLMGNLSPEQRQELEEARRQMEQLPPAQRQMMERMMGDQLRQLEQMMAGEDMQVQVVVKSLEVNAGRPE